MKALLACDESRCKSTVALILKLTIFFPLQIKNSAFFLSLLISIVYSYNFTTVFRLSAPVHSLLCNAVLFCSSILFIFYFSTDYIALSWLYNINFPIKRRYGFSFAAFDLSEMCIVVEFEIAKGWKILMEKVFYLRNFIIIFVRFCYLREILRWSGLVDGNFWMFAGCFVFNNAVLFWKIKIFMFL